MANDKIKNAIASEVYGSLNHGRLKDKLDWVDSVTFTIDDRLETLNIKEINDIVEKMQRHQTHTVANQRSQRQTSNKHYRPT